MGEDTKRRIHLLVGDVLKCGLPRGRGIWNKPDLSLVTCERCLDGKDPPPPPKTIELAIGSVEEVDVEAEKEKGRYCITHEYKDDDKDKDLRTCKKCLFDFHFYRCPKCGAHHTIGHRAHYGFWLHCVCKHEYAVDKTGKVIDEGGDEGGEGVGGEKVGRKIHLLVEDKHKCGTPRGRGVWNKEDIALVTCVDCLK